MDPKKTLLHVPHWRKDKYDQNFPCYEASPEGESYIKKAQKMGYIVAPHANAFEIDPQNPAYQLLGQFEYREIETDKRLGWSIFREEEGGISTSPGVPMSDRRLMTTRDCNTMTKIHPGQPMWHSILRESLQKAKRAHGLDCIFTDITLCTFNLNNSLVNDMTTTEGAKQLHQYLAKIDGGLWLGGEGLNEITMQTQIFAQTHLFRSHQINCEGLERVVSVPIGEFLWGKLCRTIGYSRLNGDSEHDILRMKIHEDHGAIPTITCRTAAEIENPCPGIKRQFELAKKG